MNLENTLTDDLRSVVATLPTPPPPAAAALVREAERTRVRSRARAAGLLTAAAAAVLVVILAGQRLGDPDAGPSPAPQPTTTTEAPPRIPYLDADRLYVDGKRLPGSWSTVVAVGESAAAFPTATDPSSAVTTMTLFRDSHEVAQIPNVSAAQLAVLSQDGSKAAWIELTGKDAQLVARDLATGEELGRVPVERRLLAHEGEENEGWETLQRIADDGTVTWGSVLVTHTWKPGSTPVDRQPTSTPTIPAGFPSDATDLVVNLDGTWAAWRTDRAGHTDPGDSDADPPWTPQAVTVQRAGDPSTRHTFAMPAGALAGQLTWESDHEVLVYVSEDDTGVAWHFLRCDVRAGDCEVARTSTGG